MRINKIDYSVFMKIWKRLFNNNQRTRLQYKITDTKYMIMVTDTDNYVYYLTTLAKQQVTQDIINFLNQYGDQVLILDDMDFERGEGIEVESVAELFEN